MISRKVFASGYILSLSVLFIAGLILIAREQRLILDGISGSARLLAASILVLVPLLAFAIKAGKATKIHRITKEEESVPVTLHLFIVGIILWIYSIVLVAKLNEYSADGQDYYLVAIIENMEVTSGKFGGTPKVKISYNNENQKITIDERLFLELRGNRHVILSIKKGMFSDWINSLHKKTTPYSRELSKDEAHRFGSHYNDT